MPGSALKEGGILVADEQPAFPMHWDSIAHFWQVMTQAGPWHARLLQLGEDHMEALRQEFMAPYASTADDQIEHSPHARLFLIRKQAAAL